MVSCSKFGASLKSHHVHDAGLSPERAEIFTGYPKFPVNSRGVQTTYIDLKIWDLPKIPPRGWRGFTACRTSSTQQQLCIHVQGPHTTTRNNPGTWMSCFSLSVTTLALSIWFHSLRTTTGSNFWPLCSALALQYFQVQHNWWFFALHICGWLLG